MYAGIGGYSFTRITTSHIDWFNIMDSDIDCSILHKLPTWIIAPEADPYPSPTK